jgi:hypothetical protein
MALTSFRERVAGVDSFSGSHAGKRIVFLVVAVLNELATRGRKFTAFL